MRMLVVGGSDAGISAAIRAREVDPSAQVTVAMADDFPNFSICGLPFFLSGETPDWRQLAHRTEFDGIVLLRNHRATAIDRQAKRLFLSTSEGIKRDIPYDKLVIATGAEPVTPDCERQACTRCTPWKTASRLSDIWRSGNHAQP